MRISDVPSGAVSLAATFRDGDGEDFQAITSYVVGFEPSEISTIPADSELE